MLLLMFLRHHNKVLDATSIMRYTGLPNNAQLEMAEAQRTRAETQVKVGLALESGDRLMGEFQPLGKSLKQETYLQILV